MFGPTSCVVCVDSIELGRVETGTDFTFVAAKVAVCENNATPPTKAKDVAAMINLFNEKTSFLVMGLV